MKKKNLLIEPGCITCGLCAFTAPDIFEINSIAEIKEGCDLDTHHDVIRLAVQECPVSVIRYTDETD